MDNYEIAQPKMYIAKQRFIAAIEVDDVWLKMLEEDGYTGWSKGDYYIKKINGEFEMFDKKRFENLFELSIDHVGKIVEFT
jgi:hypothetical protein